jgi:hypothetical protein
VSFKTSIEIDGLLVEECLLKGPARPVPVKSMGEIICNWFPPTVRTTSGEYVFVSAEHVRALCDLGQQFGIPFVERVDVWSFLLEPFLDTQTSAADIALFNQRLKENGITEKEAKSIRNRVETEMKQLTNLTWEWFHYGMMDVLEATEATYQSPWSQFVFSIADRANTKPSSAAQVLRLFNK